MMTPPAASNLASPDNLSYHGSALDAFDELAKARTNIELLHLTHLMWCDASCPKDLSCEFLHYDRSSSVTPSVERSARSRYNRETSSLFTLMGGQGYVPGTRRAHKVNSWPFIEDLMIKADNARERCSLVYCDYTDWSKKSDCTAEQSIRYACRDTLQWMGSWCGANYPDSRPGLLYIAYSTIVDDICIPPLDLMNQTFRVYRTSAREMIKAMVEEGWARDSLHGLLALVRQYILQYAEKIDFDTALDGFRGMHDALNRGNTVWDSVVYRTHTANTYGAAIVIGHVTRTGVLKYNWIFDSAICDAISMDLCKSALRVYEQDNHKPTVTPKQQGAQEIVQQRQASYHSIYLDLIDELVIGGAPDAIVHFGRAGFLYVQIHHRYQERRIGNRFPISSAMERHLKELFGDYATDPHIDGLYRLRWLVEQCRTRHKFPDGAPGLPAAVLYACLARQMKLKWAFTQQRIKEPSILANSYDGRIDAIHSLSRIATGPNELHSLISKKSSLLSVPVQCQVGSVCSLENMWALCVACQVTCAEDCEWLAFAHYVCAVIPNVL